MIKLFDRVKVNIPTTGTGDITFGAAASTAFLTPAEAGALDSDEVRYVIVDGLDFEEGVGLIKDTVATMERTVTKSKIGGTVGTSALNLSGTAVLALTASAADILTPDAGMARSVYDPNAVEDDAFDAANFKVAGGDFLTYLPWYARGIGEIVYVDTSIAGVSTPPASHADLVYIELTAGKTGSGAYNNGKLTSESVTGSAPLVLATATISVVGSPINGKTVHLINTEEAILRPRASGVGSLQQDQMQQITGSFSSYSGGINTAAGAFSKSGSGFRTDPTISIENSANFDSANSPGARAGAETRMKNVGVTAYMRIK